MTAGSRRHRQRETILTAATAGDVARATALLAEHVLEFPDDVALLDGMTRNRHSSATGASTPSGAT